MGYRSEVAIVLYKKDYEDLIKNAEIEANSFGKELSILSEPVKYFQYNGEDYTFLYWRSVKWYGCFDEILLIDKTMRVNDHAFIRIGEETDDVDVDISGDDFYEFLQLQTTIIFSPVILSAKETKHDYVYIVSRKNQFGNILRFFVFKQREDAMKCSERLKEMYPDETIGFEKHIIREEYK